jgi:hypothetical protein
MAQTIDELFSGGDTTTQSVAPSQVDNIPVTVDDVFRGSPWQVDERQQEKGMEVILSGLPDGGRILRDRNTNQLHLVSKGYTTSNQDEIKRVMDERLKGEAVDLGVEAESKFKKDILGQLPESGLLAQQFFRGGLGLGSSVDEAVTDNPTDKWKYEKVRKAYEDEYPERAYPAQIAGLGASTYLTGGVASLAKNIPGIGKGVTKGMDAIKSWYDNLPKLGKIATNVGGTTGAATIEGLIYGAGEGNTTDERTISALETGGLNALITLPIATAFPVVGSLMNRFNVDKAKIGALATEFGISVESARMIKDAFNSGSTIAEMLEKVTRSGDSRMIADANEAFAKLLDAAGTVSTSIGGQVHKTVGTRVQDTAAQLSGDLDVTLGTQPQGTQTILENVAESTKTARKDAYDKANAFPVDYNTPQGVEIIRTLRLLDKTTIDKVNRLFAMEGKKVRIKYKGVDKNGNLVFDDLPNTEALNLLKIQLDKVVEGGTDPITKNLLDIDVMVAQAARNSIRDNLKAINPYYADALKQGQGKILTQKAVLLGQQLLTNKITADEVKIFMRNASAEERKAIRQGVREQIENIMSNAKTASTTGRATDVSEAMKLITDMSSRSVRFKMEQILGKQTADAMFRRLDEARSAIELQAATRTGSQTASRQQIIGAAETMIERGPLGTLFEAQPVKAIQKLRDFFAGSGEDFLQQRKEEIFKEVADLLTRTGKGGKDVDTALLYLNKMRKGEDLTQPQASFLTLFVKKGLQSKAVQTSTGVGTQRYSTDEK